jgi:hypothetical protein
MNLPLPMRRFDDLGFALAVLLPVSLLFTFAVALDLRHESAHAVAHAAASQPRPGPRAPALAASFAVPGASRRSHE